MNDFVEQMKSAVGRTFKSIRVDPKTGYTHLEFEDSSLNTKLTLNFRSVAFIGSLTSPVKKAVNKKLKAKEEALAPQTKPVVKKTAKAKTTPQ
jgi:hypothetical protein